MGYSSLYYGRLWIGLNILKLMLKSLVTDNLCPPLFSELFQILSEQKKVLKHIIPLAIHGYYHYQMPLYYKVKSIVYLQFILEITNVYSLGL